jgi:hypothetical protein
MIVLYVGTKEIYCVRCVRWYMHVAHVQIRNLERTREGLQR